MMRESGWYWVRIAIEGWCVAKFEPGYGWDVATWKSDFAPYRDADFAEIDERRIVRAA